VKVVIDTNVFISGVFFSGAPYLVLRAWRDDKIQVVLSLEIMAEYRRIGEIIAQDHPGIELTKMLDFVFQNAVIYDAPHFLSILVKTRTTKNSWHVRWPAEAS